MACFQFPSSVSWRIVKKVCLTWKEEKYNIQQM